MQVLTKKQARIKVVGESIASVVAQRLQPNFRVVESGKKKLEWQILDAQGIYQGGFCWDETWIHVCAPLPEGTNWNVPFVSQAARQTIRGIVWDAIAEVNTRRFL